MIPSRTDMIQSFRLRFWRESRQGVSEDWRGDVWHEQQKPGEEAVVVANPEAAFELVRQTLQISSGKRDAEIHPIVRAGGDGRVSSREALPGPLNQAHPLLAIWRKFRGEQP